MLDLRLRLQLAEPHRATASQRASAARTCSQRWACFTFVSLPDQRLDDDASAT
jgi:hypothetical protein